jgi:hypothetical protein
LGWLAAVVIKRPVNPGRNDGNASGAEGLPKMGMLCFAGAINRNHNEIK